MKGANAAMTLLEKLPEKNSGFERDLNPQPLHYWCNALPTELSKPHESGCVWIRPFMFSGRNTWLNYTVVQIPCQKNAFDLLVIIEIFLGFFSD